MHYSIEDIVTAYKAGLISKNDAEIAIAACIDAAQELHEASVKLYERSDG